MDELHNILNPNSKSKADLIKITYDVVNKSLILPEGYKYCPECKGLTPHRKITSQIHKVFDIFYCVCCDSTTGYEDKCSNCYYEFPEIEDLEIIINSNQDLLDHEINSNIELIDSDSELYPYKIFKVPFILNYKEKPDNFNMDCYNAIDWEYDIICPICGTLNHFKDSNC